MKEKIESLIECAKNNKKALRHLKMAAIVAQQYELAAEIRQIEKDTFPETLEQKEAKLFAGKLNTAFRMAGLTVGPKTCWVLGNVVLQYSKKKERFSLSDASSIVSKAEQYFEDELNPLNE